MKKNTTKTNELKGISFIDIKKKTLERDYLFEGLKDVVDINELKEEIRETLKYGGRVYGFKKRNKGGKPFLIMCAIITNNTLLGNDEEVANRHKLSALFKDIKDEYEFKKIYTNKDYATDGVKNYFLSTVNPIMQDSLSYGLVYSYKIGELKYELNNYPVFGQIISMPLLAIFAGLIFFLITHNFCLALSAWLLITCLASARTTFKGKIVNGDKYFRSLTFDKNDAFKAFKDFENIDELRASVNALFVTSL